MSAPGAAADATRVGAAVVAAAPRLRGEPALPGDKSISHRALLLALLADGESRILGAGDGEDVRTTAAVVAQLGAVVERTGESGGRVDYRVSSPGREAIDEPGGVLDCRNSGTTLRMTAGILAARAGFAVLDGDESLRRRPVARVVTPLGAMGATFAARAAGRSRPSRSPGSAPLRAIDYAARSRAPRSSRRSCSRGWARRGRRRCARRWSRATTRSGCSARAGVDVRSAAWGADGLGQAVSIDGQAAVLPADERVPADPSAAAFWLVAGAVHPDAELTLRGVGTNPSRRAIIDLLRRMGAAVEERTLGDAARTGDEVGEPLADLVVRSSELHGIDVVAGGGRDGDRRGADPLPGSRRRVGDDDDPRRGGAATQGIGPNRRHRRRPHGPRRPRIGRRGRHHDPRRCPAHRRRHREPERPPARDDVRRRGPHRHRGDGRARSGSASISYPGFFSEIERVRA